MEVALATTAPPVPAAAIEPADHGRVSVIEENGAAGVQGGDASHVLLCQGEVEDVEVLFHTLTMDRFRDDRDVTLDEPSKHDLGNGLVV